MPTDISSPATRLAPVDLLARADSEGRRSLLEPEVYALLAAGGIPVPAHRFVADARDIDAALCREIGARQAVVKLVSPDIAHKSDVGGVAVADNDPESLRAAAARVAAAARAAAPGAALRGTLVVERVAYRPAPGREMLAGFRHDRAFGPVVVLGVGGLDAEFLMAALRPETARVILPAAGLTGDTALAALRGTVVHAALCSGLRSGRDRLLPESALALLAVSLARLATRWAGFAPAGGLGIAELEVNPLVLAEDGRLVVLDGLATLHRPAALPPPRPIGRLRHLLTPASAAVLGASAGSVNAGRIILRNLVAGGGVDPERIFAVHPRAAAIDGCRAVPSPSALPAAVDMAVVAVPSGAAEGAVLDLVASRRARTITLITGGFGETEAGRGAETRIRAAAEATRGDPDGGVLINGGNCLGIISAPGGYNTFFLPPYKLPFHDAPGQNVASISQSGAYLVSQISNLDRAVRPRYAISFGNQVDVTVTDYLEYLADDPEVEVFAIYLEGFRRGDGERFLDRVRRVTRAGRTVLLYKAGRTREGTAAAASHTAAIVGEYDVCRALATAAGAIDCVTLDMFEDYLMTFAFLASRRPDRGSHAGGGAAAGRRVAVVSNAGFECAAAADKLYGLALADLSAATRARLRALLPAGVIDVHNPIDTTPITPTDLYAGCVEAVLGDPGVDAVVVAGVPATPYLESLARGEGHGEDLARPSSLPSRLIRLFQGTTKPMVFSVDSGPLYEDAVQMMKRAGLPCFRKVDRATRALGAFLAGPGSRRP